MDKKTPRQVLSERMKKLWADPEYRERVKAKLIESGLKRRGTHISQEQKDAISKARLAKWAEPGEREKMSAAQSAGSKAAWADPEKKAARLAKFRATMAAKKAAKE